MKKAFFILALLMACGVVNAQLSYRQSSLVDENDINWTDFHVPSDSVNWTAFPNDQGYITTANWDEIPTIQSSGINWTNVEEVSPITEAMIGDLGTYLTEMDWSGAVAGINWTDVEETDLDGINWTSYLDGETINWAADDFITDAAINWTDIEDITIAGTLTAASIVSTAAGQSTIDEGLVVNNDGGATETHDLVVNSDTVASAIEVDAGDDVFYINVPIKINERAADDVDLAGYGQIWVKSDAPNTLWFTNDDGTAVQLGAGVNWTAVDDNIADQQINWTSVQEITNSNINWATMTDLTTDGAVVWGNVGAGELGNDSVINEDIDDDGNFVFTGVWDFGGGVLEIPNGASPTVDSAGEIAIDTTTDQLVFYGGAKRVIPYSDRKCFGWFSPTDADDNIEVWAFKYASTVTNIVCRVSGGTSIAVVGGDGTNNFESITCADTNTADDGSITNATFSAGEVLELDLGAPSGTVPSFIYCIDFTVDAD